MHQIRNKNILMRRDIKHHPQKYLSSIPGGVQASRRISRSANHLIPIGKPLLFLFSRWDVLCLDIHRCGKTQNILSYSMLVLLCTYTRY